MKRVKDHTCFMIGMPSSGKTTFLVSLANMLMLGEQKTLLSLESCDIPEGMENIQKEIENFTEFQPVGRTSRTAAGWLKIPLLDRQGNKTWLHIPDLSGEIFMDLIRERRLKKDIAAQLQTADILLFFLNLDMLPKNQRIPLEEESAMEIIEKEYMREVIESGKNRSIAADAEKKKQITQSDLVELLQCVLYVAKKRVKMKFIISAWDSIEKRLDSENRTPKKCLEKFLPLFFQFLCSNSNQINGEIWGVSAQGFDFTNPEELERWKNDDIWEHARVITPTGAETHDLTTLLFLN